MTDADGTSGITESIEPKGHGTGRNRAKARHLSQIVRQVILDEFAATRSTEDVAESLRLPARTVSDVVLLELMRVTRKPAESERRLNFGAADKRRA